MSRKSIRFCSRRQEDSNPHFGATGVWAWTNSLSFCLFFSFSFFSSLCFLKGKIGIFLIEFLKISFKWSWICKLPAVKIGAWLKTSVSFPDSYLLILHPIILRGWRYSGRETDDTGRHAGTCGWCLVYLGLSLVSPGEKRSSWWLLSKVLLSSVVGLLHLPPHLGLGLCSHGLHS